MKNLTTEELKDCSFGSDKYIAKAKILSKYKIGKVVWDSSTGMLGHVKGFDRAECDAGYVTILKVHWDNGQTYSIHPLNIVVL